MANIRLGLPNIDAAATYAERNTGGSWSAESVLDYGFGEPTRAFSSGVCDELRITLTYSQEYSFDRLFLSTLNIVSGLSFSIDIDSNNILFSQDTEANPRPKQNQLKRFSATNGTTVILTITGINQRRLSFGQLCLCGEGFSPSLDIMNSSSLRRNKVYTKERTALGFVQKLDDSAREYVCNFLKLSEAEFDSLERLIDVRANDGFLLFELDQSSTDLNNAFLGYFSIASYQPQQTDFISAEMNILEAYGRG